MSQAKLSCKKLGENSPRRFPLSGNVYIISDSSADLQSNILEAFRLQFPTKILAVRVEPFVQSTQRLREILSRARNERAAICHVLMSPKLREKTAAYCKRHCVPCCDLLGDMFDFLSSLATHGPHPRSSTIRRHGRTTRRETTVVAVYD